MSKESSTIKLASDLALPVEISGRRTAIFGISGSGKSNTATVLIEGLLSAGEQVVIIDPKGEAWGLLSLLNGKPSNLPLIIFGEPNGHIETLADTHGPKLADFVFESGQSVALSLLGFESDQSERRFVAQFLRQLYRRKSRNAKKTRTLVVFDEAHLFVPELGGQAAGDKAELAGAVQRIARQGRTFGLGSLFIDQRPQDVAKRVISQVDTIVCHQLSHNKDRAALSDWVSGYDTDGRGKLFLESLASLEPGESWVWSPSWLKIFKRAKIFYRKTFDSGAAPDDSAATKVQRAAVDLDKLRGQLAEIVEKAKADDPKELRRQIAELRQQVKAAEKAPSIGAVEKSLREAYERGVDETIAHYKHQLEQVIVEHRKALEATTVRLEAIRPFAKASRKQTVHVPRSAMRQALPAERKPTYTGNGEALPKGERLVLTAIGQHHASGGVDRAQISILTGYKRSTRDAYLQRLSEKGYWTDGNGGSIILTEAGEAALGPEFEPLPTGSALLEYWLRRLPDGERKCLEIIVAAGVDTPVGRDEIGEATEYKRSTRDAYLQRLSARKLIYDAGRGMVCASGELFD